MFHHEGTQTFQPLRTIADMTCAMYNYDLLLIDRVGDLDKSPMAWSSIDDAMNDLRFKDYKWVFLDARGDNWLHEYQHPEENVVYVFGGDQHGYDKPSNEYGGEVLRLKSEVQGMEHYALVILSAVANHRYFQVEANQ